MSWTYTALCKRNASQLFAEISEITRISANCVLSFQTKKRQNFGTSVVIMSGKNLYIGSIYTSSSQHGFTSSGCSAF